MDNIKALLSQSDGNNVASGPLTGNYMSSAPFFTSDTPPTMDTTQSAASNNIAAGLGKMFGPGESLYSRTIEGPIEALGGVFGLPQELTTRALTGNQYAVPSQVPAVQAIFGNNAVGHFAANLMLDPLNLALVPALAKMYKGAVEGAQLPAKLAEGMDAYRTAGQYIFRSPEDLSRLEAAAGVGANHVQYGPNGGWTWDFNSHPDPEAFKSAIDTAMAGHEVSDALFPGRVYMGDDGKFHTATEPTNRAAAATVSEFPAGNIDASQSRLFPGQSLLSNPRRVTPAGEEIGQTLWSGSKGYDTTQKDVAGIFTSLDPELLKDPSSPYARALVHGVMDPAEGFAKDAAALATKNADLPKYVKDVESLSTSMQDKMKQYAGWKVGDKANQMSVLEWLQEQAATGSGLNVPPDFISKFGYNPNNANLMDLANSFSHSLASTSNKLPIAQAFEKAISDGGIYADMPKDTKKFYQDVVDGWMGKPTDLDNQAAALLSGNKDKMQQLILGNDLAEAVYKGDKSLADLTGLQGWAARKVESLTNSATPLTSAAAKVRDTIHQSMLGLAFDTAGKVLTQVINPIVENGLGRSLEAAGAYMGNPQVRDMMRADHVIGNQMQTFGDVLSSVMAPGQKSMTLKDVIMTPFNAAEDFRRGVSYLGAFKNYSQSGMTLAEAADAASAATKDMMFAYGPADMTPLMRNPIAKAMFQFQTYPLKQAGKLLEYMQTGNGLNNMAVRYATYLGGIVGYASHIGLDAKDVFVDGLFPQHIFGGSLADSPTFKLIGGLKDMGSGVINYLAGGPSASNISSPDQFWRGVGDVLRSTVPAGRYLGKVATDGFESQGFWGPLLSQDWNVRRSIADHPYIASMLKVNPDPGINGMDMLAKLVGFKTMHETNRDELMDMITKFTDRYREAIGKLNSAASSGGDVQAVKDRAVQDINSAFGGVFQKYGVPLYSIMDSLHPSNQSYIDKYKANHDLPVEQEKGLRLPAAIKHSFSFPQQ